jgi:hypothetical protein
VNLHYRVIADAPTKLRRGVSATMSPVRTACRDLSPQTRASDSGKSRRLNRTGFIGELFPREDGADAPSQQVFP